MSILYYSAFLAILLLVHSTEGGHRKNDKHDKHDKHGKYGKYQKKVEQGE